MKGGRATSAASASAPSVEWLLLVVSLPTEGATARMRIWRTLKALGCRALRDGAYLLPAGEGRAQALQELADECTREGGSAWLMTVEPRSADDNAAYRALFDRGDEYAELRRAWQAAHRGLGALDAADLARLKRKLERERDALRAIDFFPNDASAEADAAWDELAERIAALLAPDEPQRTRGSLVRLDRAHYRGRTWATRRRLWVDRVASAWLIRRFIDPDARFRWLASPAECPKRALGFDFDGATFSHVGDRVTFETLLASFGLDDDPALARIAAIVHALDVGGEPVAEASGFEAVLAGARERWRDDDDALLAEIGTVLDSLHAHFGSKAAANGARGRNGEKRP
jgi:hypothetical protein